MSRRDDLGLEPRLDVAAAIMASLGLDPTEGRETAERAVVAGRGDGRRDGYQNALVAELDLALLDADGEQFEDTLQECRDAAAGRPSPWWSLQLDLVEARHLLRTGRQDDSERLLDHVAQHELADNRVLRRDLAEARAWIALERGRFGEARALAAEAVGIDQETGERCSQLRPRLVELVAAVAANENVSLGTIADLKSLARETGLMKVVQLATRWLYVDELTQGWSIDLHALEDTDLVECRALDLEIEALSHRRFRRLLDAAEVWSEIGDTVWRARALLWHSELTGTPSPEADELLTRLQAPVDRARMLRSQVAVLKS
jgi:hypothetical protein